MDKTPQQILRVRNDTVRTLHHTLHKGRYWMRTHPYTSMAVSLAAGIIVGFLLSGGKTPPKNT